MPVHTVFLWNEWNQIARRLQLSRRERQVLQRVSLDWTEREIALSLEISVHTVHAHLERVYEKLGVRSRVQAIVRVFVEYRHMLIGKDAVPRLQLAPMRPPTQEPSLRRDAVLRHNPQRRVKPGAKRSTPRRYAAASG